jgi:hypothetical protein
VTARSFAAATFALLSACATQQTDYGPYRAHLPRSILVLPPLNETPDVNAPYVYLSTVTRPLAECGYYVFPVAAVDAFMKENGLPTAGEMHGASLGKLREVFGADAVLYVTLESWGQKYRIISSDTEVKARAHLVDVVTGTTLWTGTAKAQHSSAAGQSDLISMVLAALVTQITARFTDPSHDLARAANGTMVFDDRRGLLLGPQHPGFDGDTRGR